MPGDLVLVTGASGFVGSAVARKLAKSGQRVRVLVRKASPRANVTGFACEIAEGDMRDTASLAAAMKDVRHLFHVAADYRLWARDRNEIVENNREGTRNVMQAAKDAGVERIVYTSSVATLKPKPGRDATEEDRADRRNRHRPFTRKAKSRPNAWSRTWSRKDCPPCW